MSTLHEDLPPTYIYDISLNCGKKSKHTFYVPYIFSRGPGSSVGIATGYGLDGPAIESSLFELSTRVVLGALTTGLVWEVEATESE
jgi:hypothetical protein